jgi:hypothetical protein
LSSPCWNQRRGWKKRTGHARARTTPPERQRGGSGRCTLSLD